jgi:hypothetical protein
MTTTIETRPTVGTATPPGEEFERGERGGTKNVIWSSEPVLTEGAAAELAEYVRDADPWYHCSVRQVGASSCGFAPLYGVVLIHRGTGQDVPPLFKTADYARHMRDLPWLYSAEKRAEFAYWRAGVDSQAV